MDTDACACDGQEASASVVPEHLGGFVSSSHPPFAKEAIFAHHSLRRRHPRIRHGQGGHTMGKARGIQASCGGCCGARMRGTTAKKEIGRATNLICINH